MANCDTESKTHAALLKLWGDLLAQPGICIHDDFFEAGGSSMQAIEMLWTVSSMFRTDIDYAEFFKAPCIRRLSELLEGRGAIEAI